MANLTRDILFGLPAERLEVEATLRRLKLSRYGLAKLAEVHTATACRWRTWIPKAYHEKIKPALKAAQK